MHRPINILDLRDSPWVDGPGRTVLQTAESLDSERFKLIVGGFCGDDVNANIYLSDASQRGLDTCAIVEQAAFDLNVVRQLMATIEELDIDMLHTHDFRSNLAGLYCAWRKQIPIVSTCHGWIANNFKRSVYKSVDIRLLRRFDRVITVSELMKRQLLAEGVQAQNIDVVVNALVINDYQPNHDDRRFRSELGIADDCVLLLNIGRLSLEKGQALLLEAYAEINRTNSNTRLAFVGIGPEESSLRTLTAELGLQDRILFAGYQSDMLAVYNSADLVIQSSFTEGMPNVILESLLMETPVVATDVGGTGEVFVHNVSGTLIDAHSKQQLVDGVADYLADPDRHLAMARRGRQTIAEKFDHDSRVKKFEAIYSSLMSGRVG
ncbi:glycosyltransferase family 4 protein [Woeseia oceani]|uniref:Uncharacterized protein n=1 Tax=Woeseia oceani TaxID=1548547 RepID=A0A193LEM7_9GAMM|nr:glycosyltransferase family 4 protein [Woeseia oceani]ANO50962.1 hypothetical protein BA177_06845 [Woeseia oceani]